MKKTLLIVSFLFLYQNLSAEIIIFKNCSGDKYSYEKNDYTLNLKKEMMTREFIYTEKSYKEWEISSKDTLLF